MMKEILIILTIVSLLYACENRSKRVSNKLVDEFPVTYNVKGEVMNTVKYLQINSLMLFDTLLVVISQHQSSYFQVYSTVTEKLVGSFSGKGRGPGEFLSMDLVKNGGGSDRLLLHAFDWTNQSITKINISKCIQENKFIFERSRLEINGDNRSIETVLSITDDVIIFREVDQKTAFSILFIDSSRIIEVPYGIPREDFIILDKHKSPVFFATGVAINSELRKIAYGPYLIGQLDIFSLDGNPLSSSLYVKPLEMRRILEEYYSNENLSNYIRYNMHLTSDEKSIYILNDNYRFGLIPESTDSKKMTSIPKPEIVGHTNELLVFDWNGNPVKKILFDRFISDYTIDSKRRIIYAKCHYPFESDVIVRYNF